MEIDQVVENNKSTQHIFKCDICEEIVKDVNELMKHKSDKHKDSVSNSKKEQVFQKVTSNSFPPDQMSEMFWMMKDFMRRMNGMEKRLDEILI